MSIRSSHIFLLAAIVFSVNSYAQTKPFTSTEGRFSVGLPAKPTEESPTTMNEEGVTEGKQFKWLLVNKNVELFFFIHYADSGWAKKGEETARLARAADGIIESFQAKGDTLISRQDIKLGEYPGIEVRYRKNKTFITINRYYMAGPRFYGVMAMFRPGPNEARALKILDSWKITAAVPFAADIYSPENPFVSREGRFSIALPARPTEEVNPVLGETKVEGRRFSWRVEDVQATFVILYVEVPLAKKEEAAERVETAADGYIGAIPGTGTVTLRRNITLDGYPGVEVKAREKDGFVAVVRYYMVNTRLYFVQAMWTSGPRDADVVKIMDSFKAN